MCESCVSTIDLFPDVTVHVGYDATLDAEKDRLLEGDMVLESDTKYRISQAEWFELWDSLAKKLPDEEAMGKDPSETMECASCKRPLFPIPAIDTDCLVCEKSKVETTSRIADGAPPIERDEYEQELADDDREDPITLALRSGLICPEGHWVCTDCLVHRRAALELV
ncbi:MULTISPECIES: hypothetical protein [unclassified Haladaptatus]|uniref:hypothetical protein n=1 Tax=unclassified Haladaptatus TaxID=2622732 RepID=UPI0023E8A605|nr:MULTISPECIES: hypothetical protein [unclassified Haladaptatus]